MLGGIRGALDVFQPMVFERTAADLVAATATKEWRAEHGDRDGLWLRRRLRKQAKDMVRPGRPVADLHAALLEVQAQREIWQAHCPSGGWPRLPEGLAPSRRSTPPVRADLDALDEVLATTPGGAGLVEPAVRGADRAPARGCASDTDALSDLPERTALAAPPALGRPRRAARRPRRPAASTPRSPPAELDLAWWSTVFEQILSEDPALAGYDGAALGALVRAVRDARPRARRRACPDRCAARSSGTSRTRCASTASRPRRSSRSWSRSG